MDGYATKAMQIVGLNNRSHICTVINSQPLTKIYHMEKVLLVLNNCVIL